MNAQSGQSSPAKLANSRRFAYNSWTSSQNIRENTGTFRSVSGGRSAMSIPIYKRIQQFILSRINSGQWAADTLIPTEAELSRLFACSRISVTTALRELVKDGVIYRIQGKGTYVSPRNETASPYDNSSLMNSTLSIEDISVPGTHRTVSVRTEPLSEETAAVLRLPPGSPAIAIDRLKYSGDRPIFVERVYLPQHLFGPVLEQHLEDEHLSKVAEQCGITLGKSVVSSEPALCPADVAKLLGLPEGSPVLRFSIEVHDTQERPIAYYFVYAEGKQRKVMML